MNKKNDLDNWVQIQRGLYWIGFYDETSSLNCNPYLLIDDDDIILFDPGSIPHFPVVMRKVIDIINPEDITNIVVHHQDPDVCGNLAVVEDLINRKDLKIVTHSSNARFLEHLGVNSEFYAVDKHDYKLTLKSGRVLEFLFTPYLHSPFGIITYDKTSKSLFSADIFGAISSNWDLFAQTDFLSPITDWHKAIMPSSKILSPLMKRLEQMPIESILPQHGSIIEGDKIPKAIEHLKNLPCGIDIGGENQ